MKYIGVICFFIFAFSSCFPQTKQWAVFCGPSSVHSYTQDSSYIWAVNSAGLIKLNINTGQKEFFRKDNSDLPGNDIISITTDKQGNKWLCTTHGLDMYDGTNWINYNRNNSGLPQNFVRCVAFDSAGNKWIGTQDSGLVKYDGKKWTVFNYKNAGLPNNMVDGIYIDKKGNVWANFWYEYIAKFDGKQWTRFYFSSACIFGIVEDAEGCIWVGTSGNSYSYYGGLSKFDGKYWNQYSPSNSGLPTNHVYTLTVDKYNNKWVGTDSGLVKYDDKNWSFISSGRISSLSIDYMGNVWFRNENGGLTKFDGQNRTEYQMQNPLLKSAFISDMRFDKKGNAWIPLAGSGGSPVYLGGLLKCDYRKWSLYNTSNSGLPDNNLRCLEIDSQDNLWIGTDSGLVKYDGKNWTIYNKSNSGLPGNNIFRITIDSHSNIWMAVRDIGIVRFDGQNWTVYNKTNTGYDLNDILSVYADKNGNFWVGVSQNVGLIKYDGQNWSMNNKTSAGSHFGNVTSFAEDPRGDLWMANIDGLIKYDGQNFIYFNKSDLGVKSDYITKIAIDSLGNKWMGTQWAGVTRYDGQSSVTYNSANSPLLTDGIFSLAVDPKGNKWIATAGGLCVFREDGINIPDENSIDTIKTDVPVTIKNYTLEQNYPNPFNPSTSISFTIPKEQNVRLVVYDILGREIKTLLDDNKSAGRHKVQFNASSLPSGIYVYTIYAGEYRASRKLMLLK